MRLWSADKTEQRRIGGTPVAGGLPISDCGLERQFGVYLNDGTGAKMDYYLEKTRLRRQSVCRKDGRPTSDRRGHHEEHGTRRCRDEPARRT